MGTMLRLTSMKHANPTKCTLLLTLSTVVFLRILLVPSFLAIWVSLSGVDGSENFSAEVVSKGCSCKSRIVTDITLTDFTLDTDWDHEMMVGSTGPKMMNWLDSLLWRSDTPHLSSSNVTG